MRKTSPVDYIVEFKGHSKVERNLHANMLKPYFTRAEFVNVVMQKNECDDCVDYSYCIKPIENVNVSKMCDKLKHLDTSKQKEMKRIVNKYASVISDTPGCTDNFKLKIALKPNAKVIKQAPYRMSPTTQDKLKKELDQLIKDDLIEESSSEWASPCIVILKPDGSVRAVVDFRQANDQFVGDAFPLPVVEDLISRIGKAKYLTKFDLSRGFYQVQLSEESKPLTAFCTPFGLYQWKRLPYGLKTSPTQFQKFMQKTLSGLDYCCAVFIDDIIIFSDSWEDHLRDVESVFSRLLNSKLTVKLSKCLFACSIVTYLGHNIGNGSMMPIKAKVQSLLSMPRPSDKKCLKSFLGAVGYYQRYIPKYADLTSPLTEILKEKSKFVWSSDAEKAFVDLKEVLTSDAVLTIADYLKPFVLFVDASNVAVSVVLAQRNELNLFMPIAYISKKLTKCQRNYSVVEKELLAILLAVRQFACYLSGETVIYSDHEPLTFMSKLSSRNSKLLRWSLELAPYNLLVKHIKGSNNCFADFLSRPGLFCSSKNENGQCERQLLNPDGDSTAMNVKEESPISCETKLFLLSLSSIIICHSCSLLFGDHCS